MHPVYYPVIVYDPGFQMPVYLTPPPTEMPPTPYEMPIAPHQVAQLSKLNDANLLMTPNRDPNFVDNCRTFGWQLPDLKINLGHFRLFLEERLRAECWGSGTAFAPSGGTFHDINLNFFPRPFPTYAQIEEHYLAYIRFLLSTREAYCYPETFGQLNIPFHQNWLLRAAYLSQNEYAENTEASFVLRTTPPICVKVQGQNSFYSTSTEDGVIVNFRRAVMSFCLGAFFADTMEKAQKALIDHYNKIVKSIHLRKRVNFFFPLIESRTRGCIVNRHLIERALNHLWALGPNRRNLIPNRIKLQLLKLPHLEGKIIYFINLLGENQHRPHVCKLFAEGLLKYSKQLGFNNQDDFARLVVRCPEITPLLVAFMRTLFLFQWADGKMAGYQALSLPPGIPMIRNSNYQASIACQVGQDMYHLSLTAPGEPFYVCLDGAKAYNRLFELINQHGSPELLHGVLACFGMSPEYLDRDLFFGKMTQIFTLPRVQKTYETLFPNQYKPQRMREVLHELVSGDPAAHVNIDLNLAFFALDECLKISKSVVLEDFINALKRFLDSGGMADDERFRLMVISPQTLINDKDFQSLGITQYFLETLGKVLTGIIRITPKWNKDQLFGLYQMMSKLQVLSEEQEDAVLLALVPYLDELSEEESLKLTKEALERGMLKAPYLKAFQRLITSEDNDDLICAHRHLDLLISHGKEAHELIMRLIVCSCREFDQWAFSSFLKFAKLLTKEERKRFPPQVVIELARAVKNAKCQTKQDALQIIEILNLLLDCQLENEVIGNILGTIDTLIVKPHKVLVELAPVVEKLAAFKFDLPVQIRSEFVNLSLRLAGNKPNIHSTHYKRGRSLLKSLWTAYMGKDLYELVLKRLFKRMSDALLKMTARVNRVSRQFQIYARLVSTVADHKIKLLFKNLIKTHDLAEVEALRAQFQEATREAFPDIDISQIPKEPRRREAKEEKKQPAVASIPKETFDDSADFSKGMEAIRMLCKLVNETPEQQNAISKNFQYILVSLKRRSTFPDGARQAIVRTIFTLIGSQRKLHIRYAEDLFELAMKHRFPTEQEAHNLCKDFVRAYIFFARKFKETDWSDEIFYAFERWSEREKTENIELGLESLSYIQEGTQRDLLIASEFLANLLKRNPADPIIQGKIVKNIVLILKLCRQEQEEEWANKLTQALQQQLFSQEWIGNYVDVVFPYIFEGDGNEELFDLLSTKRFFSNMNKDKFMEAIRIISARNMPYLLPYLLPFIREAFAREEEKGKSPVQMNRREASEVLLHFIAAVGKLDTDENLITECSQLLEQHGDTFNVFGPVYQEANVHVFAKSKSLDKVKLACKTLLEGPFENDVAVKVFVESVQFNSDQYDKEFARSLYEIGKRIFTTAGNEGYILRLVSLLYSNKNVQEIGRSLFTNFIIYLKSSNKNFCTSDFSKILFAIFKSHGKIRSVLEIRQILIEQMVNLKHFDEVLDDEIKAQDILLRQQEMQNFTQAKQVFIHLKWMLNFYALGRPGLGQKAILATLEKLKALKPGLQPLTVFEKDIISVAHEKGIFDSKRSGICQTEKIPPLRTLSLTTTQCMQGIMDALVEQVTPDGLKDVCDIFLKYKESFNNGRHKDAIVFVRRWFLRLSSCLLVKSCIDDNQDTIEPFLIEFIEYPLQEIWKQEYEQVTQQPLKEVLAKRSKDTIPIGRGVFCKIMTPFLGNFAHRICLTVPLMCMIGKKGMFGRLKNGNREERVQLLRQLFNEYPFSDLELYHRHLKIDYYIENSNLDDVLQDIAKAIDMCQSEAEFRKLTSYKNGLNPTIGFFMRCATEYVKYYSLFFKAYKEKRVKNTTLQGFDLVEKLWEVDKCILFKMFFYVLSPFLGVDIILFSSSYHGHRLRVLGITDDEYLDLDQRLLAREGKEQDSKAVASAGPGPDMETMPDFKQLMKMFPMPKSGESPIEAALRASGINITKDDIAKMLEEKFGIKANPGPGAAAAAPEPASAGAGAEAGAGAAAASGAGGKKKKKKKRGKS